MVEIGSSHLPSLRYGTIVTHRLAARGAIVALIVMMSGCLSPATTRIPTIVNKHPRIEHQEAKLKDPFPDAAFGPGIGFRPRDYLVQRTEPHRSKDQFFAAIYRVAPQYPQLQTPRLTPIPPAAYYPAPAPVGFVVR